MSAKTQPKAWHLTVYVADAVNAKVKASVGERRKHRKQSEKKAEETNADGSINEQMQLLLAFDSEVELHGWVDRITRMLVQTNKSARQLFLESQPPPVAVVPQPSVTGSPVPIDLRRESAIFSAAAISPGTGFVIPPSLDPGTSL